MTRYPRPESTAIISAATTASQATPSAILRPVRTWGSAAGRTTRARRARGERSKLRPARRYIEGMERTPFIVVTTIGKNEARKIRKIVAKFEMPKRTIETGIQASGLIGRSTWMTGFTARAAFQDHPRKRPVGRPSAKARPYPAPTRKSESPAYRSRTPRAASSRKPEATASGEGKTCVFVRRTAMSQTASIKAAVALGQRYFSKFRVLIRAVLVFGSPLDLVRKADLSED